MKTKQRNLLVTLADENYVDMAKQLFSSVYHNAGRKGDYMLLSHEIPEKKLKWFKDKGILIKKCKPLYKKKTGKYKFSPVPFSKLYLFTPEFKKWKLIIFLDSDIIVKSSLQKLTKNKGFNAVIDSTCPKPYNQLVNPLFSENSLNLKEKKLKKELGKKYNLKTSAFNSGVFTFTTDIIKKFTFNNLVDLFNKYNKYKIMSYFYEQGILNLYFYKKWRPLPLIYNLFSNASPYYMKPLKPRQVRAIIIHSIGPLKLWKRTNPFYKKWKNNLDRAEKINLNQIPDKEPWQNSKIILLSLIHKLKIKPRIVRYFAEKKIKKYYRKFYDKINKSVGKFGIFLKNKNPELYSELKKIKNKL